MPRILIVDSNLPFLMRLRKALEKQGLDVRAISRPRPALKELSQQRFDVAVVDLHMDWVNMPTFIKDMRARQPDLPIVVSGQYEEDPEKVAELEAQGYLNKPYLARDLLPVVEKAIARGYTPSIRVEDQIFAGEFGDVPSFDALLEMALSQSSQLGDEPTIEDDATLGQLLSTLYDEDVEADILQRVSEKRGETIYQDVMPALVIPDDELSDDYSSTMSEESIYADASRLVQEQKWQADLAPETDNLPATSALKLANSAQAMHRFLQRVEEARKHTGRDVEVKPLPSWGRSLNQDEEDYQRALLDAVHLGEPPTSLPETFEAPPHSAQTQPVTVPEIDLYLDPSTPAQPMPSVDVAQIADDMAVAQDMSNVPFPEIKQEAPRRDRSKMLPSVDELPPEPHQVFAEPEIEAEDTPAYTEESEIVAAAADEYLTYDAEPEYSPNVEPELAVEGALEYIPEPDIFDILAEEESLIPVSVDEITRSFGIDIDEEYEAIQAAEIDEQEVEFDERSFAPEVTTADEEAVDALLNEMNDLDVIGHATLQLMEMSLESTASAILLHHDMHLVARSGELSEQTWRELEEVFNKAWIRHGLGNTRLAYEDVFGLGDILLYSQLSLNNMTLSLAFPNNIPVSQIRQQASRLRGALETLPEAEVEPIPEPTQIIAVDDEPATPASSAASTEAVADYEEPIAAVTQPSRPTGMRAPDGLRAAKPNPIPERDKGSYMSYGVLWLLEVGDVKFNKPIANALSVWIYRLAAEQDWDVHGLEIGKGWVNIHLEIPTQELIGEVLNALMDDTNARLLNALGRDEQFDDGLWAEGYSINTPGRLFTAGEIELFTDYYQRDLMR